ncbi:Uncharacterised protein [Burkholderia pseudomallei]|uniref:DUF3296 domain-containing protein n=1 Tax=Burkholderia pseudomallei TaxID=28450 RepID=UPI000A641C8E|nr:DUF3296 domain-containing protein [Burkholderia pseudomallei]CAJ2771634.1 Uncharacterised protein [Burkholderia pseudomallei]CAJ2913086.1 Uncharacterised protein [Burkholderia pseudomallei]CAJ3159084.1 Uncharacterised protein [Burkholderia pseudomallei]CAJ3187354.1 Uncharacterised protein [Burkholderia pseudomallei]CAJ5960520.1 Uncharacterised protein [Burkholderia pseudomallei]
MTAKREWLDAERAQQLADDVLGLNEVHNRTCGDRGGEILYSLAQGSLRSIVTFMQQVTRTKDVAFRIADRNGRKKAIEASSLARYFSLLGGMARLYSRRYSYSPLLRLFFSVYAKHAIRRCILRGPSRQFDNCSIEGEVFDDFIARLREEGARIDIVNKLNGWENTSDENERNVQRYLRALFDKHGSLLPVQVDLSYESSRIDEGHVSELAKTIAREHDEDMAFLYGSETDGVDTHEPLPQHEVDHVIKDRNRLCTNMPAKPSIFGSMVGHVWRIEWAYTGFYLRVVFLFEGSTPTTDVWMGDQIGQYWRECITEGRGSHRNLNLSGRKLGDGSMETGKIEWHETAKREKLMRVLCRLARRDRYVFVKPGSKCKRFGMGRKPLTKSERPRAGSVKPRRKTM